jgi:uncharacterized membrane protein
MAESKVSISDLVVMFGFTLLTAATVLLPSLAGSPVRTFCGLLFTLFVPGYALLALLFPERSTEDSLALAEDVQLSLRTGLTDLERVVLAFGASLALAVLVGLSVEVSPWDLGLQPILIGSTSLTIASVFGAAIRRSRTPSSRRFDPHLLGALHAGWKRHFRSPSRTEKIFNVILVVVVLVAVYSFVAPQDPNGLTEFYLLSEQENGTLSGQSYQTELVQGEPQTYVVGIGNYEGEQTTYTVIVELQRGTENGTGPAAERELDRFEVTVGDNRTERVSHSVEPTVTGDRLRVTYLLYRDAVPSNPTPANAYRELHLLVDVSEPSNESSGLLAPTRTRAVLQSR